MILVRAFFKTVLLAGVATMGYGQVPVLMYHAHPNLGYDEDEFIDHMDHLVAAGYTTITPDQFLAWRLEDAPLPPRPVMLTVDDNYILVYTSMWPILRERNLVMVNFVISDSVGRTTGLHYCSWEELREMEASGVIINESHSASHPHLSQLTPAQSLHELAESRRAMEANLDNRTITHFCYPYGDYDERVIRQAIEVGYAAGYSTIDDLNYRDTPLFELRRFWADGRNLESFRNMMSYDAHLPPPPGQGWVLDNDSPHFSHEPTAWIRREGVASANGGTHLIRGAGSGSIRARWALDLPEDGRYRVHTRWPGPGMNYATDAPFEIHHAGGVETVRISQRGNAGKWNSLGVFHFGDVAKIFLRDDADGPVLADAVWLEPVEPSFSNMMVLY